MLLDLAEAIADRQTPQFYEVVRSIRNATFKQLALVAPNVPVVLTDVIVHGGSGFPEENWRANIELARVRRCGLFAVTLACNLQELERRVVSEDRSSMRKVRDIAFMRAVIAERPLFDDGATARLTIDNTRLAAEACAEQIASWLAQHEAPSPKPE